MDQTEKRRFAFFVCHHKPGPMHRDDIFTPIHVGAALARTELPLCARDDSGDNISSKNPNFCELTALYWMWKNVEADYYGLFQYRRFLHFKRIGAPSVAVHEFTPETTAQLGWTRPQIEAMFAQYDIVTSKRWAVHPAGLFKLTMSNYDFYAKEHNIRDLDVVIAIIKEKHPEVYPYVLRYLYSEKCTFANLFAMRADYFKRYAEWLFSVLFSAQARIDVSGYDPYQKRVFGFLAERLCGGYVDYLAATENARVGEATVVFGIFAKPVTDGKRVLDAIEAQRAPARAYLVPERVHVTFAIDDKYAPHCGAAIASLLGAIHERQQLTIHILHDESLSPESRTLLASLAKRPETTVDFVPIASKQFEFFPSNRKHITRATYYRLVLHKVLPAEVKKTIYIDADVILADNICRIWVDLDDNFAAACADEGGVMQTRRLGLPLSHTYFNAGVCVFNLEKLRACDADILYLEAYAHNRKLISLQDQDILNIAFCDRIKLLPLRWNANARLYRWNDLDYKYSEAEATEAALNPGLIHYTDSSKPWHAACRHPLAPLYWRWRDETPWARDFIHSLMFDVAAWRARNKEWGRNLERRLRPHIKALTRKLRPRS
jgi:lipopolysaccharide biosynthesis glycosyltransferase